MTTTTCPICREVCDGCLDLDYGYKPCRKCNPTPRSEHEPIRTQKTWDLKISVLDSQEHPGFYRASVHGRGDDILVSALSRSIEGASANVLELLADEIRAVVKRSGNL